MNKLVIAALAAALSSPVVADAVRSTPSGTITALFDAMRSGDGDTIRDIFKDHSPLERVRHDEKFRTGSYTSWADWVDTLNPGQADEQIFEVKINQFGPLASVWAPFTVALDGEIKGCGVNQFTMVREAEKWYITHGIDTHYNGDCENFRSIYKAE